MTRRTHHRMRFSIASHHNKSCNTGQYGMSIWILIDLEFYSKLQSFWGWYVIEIAGHWQYSATSTQPLVQHILLSHPPYSPPPLPEPYSATSETQSSKSSPKKPTLKSQQPNIQRGGGESYTDKPP